MPRRDFGASLSLSALDPHGTRSLSRDRSRVRDLVSVFAVPGPLARDSVRAKGVAAVIASSSPTRLVLRRKILLAGEEPPP